MKNLRFLAISSVNFESINCAVPAACIDTQNEIVYVLRGKNLSAIHKGGSYFSQVVEDLPASFIENVPISVEFLTGDDQICVVYTNGKIVVMDVGGYPDAIFFNEVAEISALILGGAWSPDQQQLILASNDGLIALSREFDILKRIPLRPPHRGRDELKTVGWGSRQTQFQGSAGRQNREIVDVNQVPVPATKSDDGSVCIAWRADGQFFAVSSMDTVETDDRGKIFCRQMRVWDRDIELTSRCEFLAGMENCLCYCPIGNLIATTQLQNDQRFVRFFERNGQYRGKFPVPAKHSVDFIGWNIDATVLAIYFAAEWSHQLQFWTVSNYDWMLKLQHNFDEPLNGVLWDQENAMRIHTMSRGQYHRIDLYSTFTFNDGVVVSISGDKARLTDLRMAPIPPPLCHETIALNGGVPFDFVIGYGQLATLSVDRRTVHIYNIANVNHAVLASIIHVNTKNDTFEQYLDNIYNLQWKSPTELSVCSRSSSKNYFCIAEIELENRSVRTNIHTLMGGSVYWHKFNAANCRYDIVCEDGVGGYAIYDKCVPSGKFPAGTPTCHYVAELDCLLALTKNHQLCLCNENNALAGVSSFSVVGEFLLVTTFAHFLFAINLKDLKAAANQNKGRAGNWFVDLFRDGRPVERGAVLVGHEADGTRVWLQMPRGNLEIIHPRALVVHRLKRLLNGLKFGEALVEMRRHRIDTNLLYDHNPEHFSENITQLIDQVESVEHLNLFITNLRSENTRLSMFAPYYSTNNEENGRREKTLSVGDICVKIRYHIEERLADDNGGGELNLAVLSCYFMERKISEALLYLALQTRKSAAKDRAEFFRKLLNYLTVLVNEQDLFRYALNTYDLQLAVDVLTNTNKDPKEMLPILNKFKAYEPVEYQRYHIDIYLGNFSSALYQIALLAVDSDELFAECVDCIVKHRLHALALSLFINTNRRKEICKLCGEFALKQRFFHEAGIMLQLAGHSTAALDAFISAQNFRYCRLLLDLGAVDTVAYKRANKKLCLQLAAQHKYAARLECLRSANELAADDLQSSELMEFSVDVFDWESAFRYATVCDKQNGNTDKLTLLCERVTDRAETIGRQLIEWTDAVTLHSARLATLRTTKSRQLREWVDVNNDEDGAPPFDAMTQSETLSDTSVSSSTSHISKLSKVSTATSRKRKQIERKKKTIKEGSHYEDAALLTALKEIYNAYDSLQDELPPIVRTLLAVGGWTDGRVLDVGRDLQARLNAFDEFSAAMHPKIWPVYVEAHHLPGPLVEIYRGADGIIRLPAENLMPPCLQIDDEIIAPKLKKRSNEWRMLMFAPLATK